MEKTATPNTAIQHLLENYKHVKDAKSVLIYFYRENVHTETTKYKNEYSGVERLNHYITIKPVKINLVIDGKYRSLDKAVPDFEKYGIRFETHKKTKRGFMNPSCELKTTSPVNIMQILVADSSFEKKPSVWSDSDKSETIIYHKWQITVRAKEAKDITINEELMKAFVDDPFEPAEVEDHDFDDE